MKISEIFLISASRYSKKLYERWLNSKLKVVRVIFTPYFLPHSIMHYYKTSTKHFEIIAPAALKKNLGPPTLKHNNDSCLQEDQEL